MRVRRLIVGVTSALIGAGAVAAWLPAQAVVPSQVLAGSSFDIDGNATGSADWLSPPAGITVTSKVDTTPKASDESFSQGTKSDTEVPTVETGSIPPNKSDLTRMRIGTQTVSGDIYLYVAWDRSNTLGSANMNFEFNATNELSSNGKTSIRSAGDVLITFDFANGGSTVDLGLSRWAQTSCEAGGAKSPSCWSPLVDLDASGFAIGAVSSDGTFGEAAINLTDAGVFTAGRCTSLGSAYLSSRSSDAFTAALKDFVPPQAISITNCGSIGITKTDDASPGNPLAGAQFTLYKDLGTIGGTRDATVDVVTDPALRCTTGSSGTCTIANVLFGNYWLVETIVPNGYDSAADRAVSVTSTTKVSQAFVDPRQRGAILITKTAKFKQGTGDNPGLEATFTVKDTSGATAATAATAVTTGTSTSVCVKDLLLGTYTVSETGVPSGYTGGADVTGVAVTKKAANCDTPGTYATALFENTPRSDVTLTFSPQVAGATAAKVSCGTLSPQVPDTTPDEYDDVSETYANLAPGTYTCTVIVDP